MTAKKCNKANRFHKFKHGVSKPEGQARPRWNAVSYGLFTQNSLIPGEDRESLCRLRGGFMEELKPQGEMETFLVERIISSTWRLKRAIKIDGQINMAPPEDRVERDFTVYGCYHFDHWQAYMRYETALENQIYKAMQKLAELQEAGSAAPDLSSVSDAGSSK